jgi:hypothetical protein
MFSVIAVVALRWRDVFLQKLLFFGFVARKTWLGTAFAGVLQGLWVFAAYYIGYLIFDL